MGLVVTNEKYWLTVRRAVADFGYCVSPDDCYLALRGLRTISVRMRHQQESATLRSRITGNPPRPICHVRAGGALSANCSECRRW